MEKLKEDGRAITGADAAKEWKLEKDPKTGALMRPFTGVAVVTRPLTYVRGDSSGPWRDVHEHLIDMHDQVAKACTPACLHACRRHVTSRARRIDMHDQVAKAHKTGLPKNPVAPGFDGQFFKPKAHPYEYRDDWMSQPGR